MNLEFAAGQIISSAILSEPQKKEIWGKFLEIMSISRISQTVGDIDPDTHMRSPNNIWWVFKDAFMNKIMNELEIYAILHDPPEE